jgi:GTP-binding protein HflX
MLILNKIDRINDPTVSLVLADKHPGALFVSAATGEGVEALAAEVARRCGGQRVRVTLRAHCGNGRLMQYIARHADVQHQEFDSDSARIEALMPAGHVERLATFGRDVQILHSGPAGPSR